MKIDSKVILFFWQICNNTVYLFFFAWLLHCPLIKKNKKPGDVHKTHPPGFNKSDENRNRKMLFPVKKLHKRMKRFFSDNNACGRRTNMVYYLYVGAGVPVGSYVSQHIIYQAMLSSQLNKSAGVFFSPPAGEQYLLFLYCSTYECPCQELLKKNIQALWERQIYFDNWLKICHTILAAEAAQALCCVRPWVRTRGVPALRAPLRRLFLSLWEADPYGKRHVLADTVMKF